MNNKTIAVAIVFALVGTLVFAAIAPYLSEVNAQGPPRGCPPNSPDARDAVPDDLNPGCGINKRSAMER